MSTVISTCTGNAVATICTEVDTCIPTGSGATVFQTAIIAVSVVCGMLLLALLLILVVVIISHGCAATILECLDPLRVSIVGGAANRQSSRHSRRSHHRRVMAQAVTAEAIRNIAAMDQAIADL